MLVNIDFKCSYYCFNSFLFFGKKMSTIRISNLRKFESTYGGDNG
jgi:hypothetical protein